MANTVGALRVELSAGLAEFTRDMGRAAHEAERAMGRVNRSIDSVKGTLGVLGATLSIGSFAALVKSSINAADEMGKLSQKVGVSVEALSALKYAGDLSDVSLEALGNGLKKLSVNMLDTASGTGAAKESFEALGINVKDATGNLKGSDKVLAEVADRFAGMEDGAGKTALAVKLFGKAGADLIPLLNQGSAGLGEMRAEAERLGIVMSGDMAKAAEEFNDNLTTMQAQFKALAIDSIGPLLPTLNQLTREFGETESGMDGLSTKINPLKVLLETLVITGANVAFVFEQIGTGIGGAAAQIDAFVTGGYKRALEVREMLRKDLEQNRLDLDSFEQRIMNPQGVRDVEALFDRFGGFAGSAKGKAPAITDESAKKSAESAAKKARDALQKAFDDARKQEANNLSVEFKISAAKMEGEDDAYRRWRDKLNSLLDDTPIRKTKELQDNLKLIDDAFFDGHISAEEWTQGIEKATGNVDGLGKATKDAKSFADELGFTFSSSFEKAIIGGEKFSDVLKGLAEDVARLFVRQTITKPLADAAGDLFSNFDWGSLVPSAKGNVFSAPGLSAYSGQIVDRPTLFPFASGVGLMGEAGPEAIMPLKRGPDGKLGVSGGGGVVIQITNQIDARGADAGVEQRIRRAIDEGDRQAIEKAVNKVMDLNQRGALRLT